MINKSWRERSIHFAILLLVISTYFYSYFNVNTMPARSDAPEIVGTHTNDLLSLLAIYPFEIRKTIGEYGQFPFWSPYRLGGTPIYSKPQAVFFYINLPLILFAPTIFAGVKWSILLHFAIAAGAMYSLMYYLSKKNLVAFVAAFVYTFNGFIITTLNLGQTNIIYPYAWIPLIFLFTFLAFEKKEWIAYSIAVGISFSFMVLGGGAQLFLYTSVLYIYFLLVYYFINISKGKLWHNLIKIARMSLIVIPVFFGLVAVFLLPNSDLMSIGVRSQGYSYEQSLGGTLDLNFKTIKTAFIDPHIFKKPHQDWNSAGLGLIPFLLLFASIFYVKKKKVLLFIILTIIVILIFQGSFLYFIFWKFIPQFQQVKGIFKGFALIYFILSVLTGFGFMYLLSATKKLKKNTRNFIIYSIILLLMINLTFFNNTLNMMTDIKYELSKNEVLSYIADDDNILRFRIFETGGIDWGTDHYSVTLGIHDVFGTENIWLVDYLPIYLSQANQNPAKGYGILNTKYITSTSELDIEDYNLVDKFEECGYYKNGADICQPRKSDGPYLYQNEKFLPRAYNVEQSIFVIGDKDSVLQVVYFIIANENFDPSTTVVVHGERLINNYDSEFLNNFDIIVLTQGSIDPSSNLKLTSYVNGGGNLLPDVIAGESTLSIDKLNSLLLNLEKNEDYSDVDKAKISLYTPNKIIVETKNKAGFLVMSEKFSFYEGWKAIDEMGNNKNIYRTDGVISSVYLTGNENQIIFTYVEPSFLKGAIISSVTLLLIAGYYIYHFRKKYRHKV